MTRRTLPILLIIFLSGCSSDGTTATDSAGQAGNGSGKPRIALIMKSLANEFFATMAQGATNHQQAHAEQYDLVVNGIKDERDLSRQVALVDEMVASGVDAIVIAPADSKALVPVLRRAIESGVTVVNIDNRLDAGVLQQEQIQVPFVGPDNRAGAKKVGDYLASKLSSNDVVAVLEGIRTSYNASQRREGFELAMREAGITIVDSQSQMMNAFAVGKIDDSAVAVTDGLIRNLTLRQLAGVLAHEVSHIRNEDLTVMALGDVLTRLTGTLSTIGLLVGIPAALLAGGGVVSWVTIAALVAAPTVGGLLQLALSRAREYDADLDAAGLTGDPEGLASALQTLEQKQGSMWEKLVLPGSRLPEPSLLRSHPKTPDRVERLLVPAHHNTADHCPARPANAPCPVHRASRAPATHQYGPHGIVVLGSGRWQPGIMVAPDAFMPA